MSVNRRKPCRHVGSIPNENKRSELKDRNLKIFMPRIIKDLSFQLVHNSTNNSLKAYTTWWGYTNIYVYLQHGRIYSFRENGDTVVPCMWW